ncbi:MAG: hypothetical protein QOD74_1181 [Variibacter sp.]|jgi:hypothetical protein|nr:hypothetical protein [Variibacter sp.]
MTYKFLFAILFYATAVFVSPSAVLYESRYMLSGFLLRASMVCQGNKHTSTSLSLFLDPDELKAFSKGFPTTASQWMERGTGNFNITAMKDGIRSMRICADGSSASR